ncbi:MAG: Uma2 family endonuclease [Thermodesulfobacteriota bacterium]
MDWQEVCEHPDLQNLPFKIEMNERGQVVMSPVKVYHSAFQGKIAALLYLHMEGGSVLSECAIQTAKGIKVADVAWASADRFEHIKEETACSVAPEICVEVLSLSNSDEQMDEKRNLYLQSGAKEVWFCDEKGRIRFFDSEKETRKSVLIPDFPENI